MLPQDHVAPNAYWTGVQAFKAQIEAHAAWIGLDAILDHPVDPHDRDDEDVVEIHGLAEEERFTATGAPFSPDTTADLLLILRVAGKRRDGYGQALQDKRARLRAVLLQDPDFTIAIDAIKTEPLFHEGRLVAGVAAMTVTVRPYATEYPPVLGEPLAAVDLTVDAADPRDPNLPGDGPDGRPEARALFPIDQGE